MSTIGRFIRSTADWYEKFVEPQDMGEHDVDARWEERNYRLREFFLGSNQEGPVGTVSLQDFGSDLYLGYVYLDVSQVGKGYGRDLLDFARTQGEARGKDGLVLIAHPEAKWAVKAYEKYGFRCIRKERDQVLAWKDGALEGYYEEGFHLFRYELSS